MMAVLVLVLTLAEATILANKKMMEKRASRHLQANHQHPWLLSPSSVGLLHSLPLSRLWFPVDGTAAIPPPAESQSPHTYGINTSDNTGGTQNSVANRIYTAGAEHPSATAAVAGDGYLEVLESNSRPTAWF